MWIQTQFAGLQDFCLLSDWMRDVKNVPDGSFKHESDEKLDELLKEFFCSIQKKNGQKYSKSAMVNIRSALNRHLHLPPYNRLLKNLFSRKFDLLAYGFIFLIFFTLLRLS